MDILARTATGEQRARIFAALRRRNGWVRALRLVVPALGVLILAGLGVKLFIASLGEDFGFANIHIDRDQLVVDKPTYAGNWSDGTSFAVEASSARAALDRSDIIEMTDAVLTMTKPTGAVLTAAAASAQLQTTDQLISTDGVMEIHDSEGTRGTLTRVRADAAAETLVSEGAVNIAFADGTTLVAESLDYDGKTDLWRFSRVTLTLPGTPGESQGLRPGTAPIEETAR